MSRVSGGVQHWCIPFLGGVDQVEEMIQLGGEVLQRRGESADEVMRPVL